MKLPNAQQAVADIRKLRNYCLDPASPKGSSKARVFAATLGLTQADAEFLRGALLLAAREETAAAGEADDFGRRYTADFVLNTPAGRQRVRSGWIIRRGENFPRLTTWFVLKSKQQNEM
jgi:hypothetical protein